MTVAVALLELRQYLLERIAEAADEIKEINRQLAIIKSNQLEIDLLHAEESVRA